MARNYPKVCEYIHLPFQSGNTRVLEMMNRGYTRQQYLDKIAMIKDTIPNVVLSTDIIVGFPTETDAEFEETISMVEAVRCETIFAFKYSPRPFTKAARFDGQVEESVKEDRLARLFKAHDVMAHDMVKVYDGQVLDILVEGFDENRKNLHGRSSQNKNVYFLGDKALVGSIVPVKITKAFPATFRGELVQTIETARLGEL
jgi:tRNA-2-methylthio-N6-dimethylallyladenosine synthase